MHNIVSGNIDFNKLDYIKGLSLDGYKYSYNKDKERKNALEIYEHFLKWYLKYGEIDRLYFIKGNDVVGADEKYNSTRLCLALRDKYNSKNESANYRILLDDKVLFNELCATWDIETVEVFATSYQGKVTWNSKPENGRSEERRVGKECRAVWCGG